MDLLHARRRRSSAPSCGHGSVPTFRRSGGGRGSGRAGRGREFQTAATGRRRRPRPGSPASCGPTEYGGRGGTPGMKAIYDEEMVLADAPRTVNALGLTFLAPTVMAIGTDAQKKEIIGPMLHNEVIWCQGFSEPGAGSDLAALADAGRARRRRLRRQRPEGVDHQRRARRQDLHSGPHRPGERAAPGHLDAADRHAPARRRRPPAQADERGQRVRRGVLHRRPRARSARCSAPIDDGWRTRCCCCRSSAGPRRISQYTEFHKQCDRSSSPSLDRNARQGGRDPVLRERLAPGAHRPGMPAPTTPGTSSPRPRAGPDLGFEASMTKLIWSETFQDGSARCTRPCSARKPPSSPRPQSGHRPRRADHARPCGRAPSRSGAARSQVQRNVIAERVLGLPR